VGPAFILGKLVRSWDGTGMDKNLCRTGGYGMEVLRDGSETGWKWVGMGMKSAGTGRDGCNFCPGQVYIRLR